MKIRLRRRAELERAHQLIATLTAERDEAARTAYDRGFIDGLEAGLRERLDDARAALGRVA